MTASYTTIVDCLGSTDRRKRRRGLRHLGRRRPAEPVLAPVALAASSMASSLDEFTAAINRMRRELILAFAIPAELLKEEPWRTRNHFGQVVHDESMVRNELIRRSVS